MSHEHIPTEEILKDITDTEREIEQMLQDAEYFEKTPVSSVDYRWNHMRAEHRRKGIRERQDFIEKLRAILIERQGVTVQAPSISPEEYEEEMRKEWAK